MNSRFLNVLGLLDVTARAHASNARCASHPPEERQRSEYLCLEFCDAIRALGAEPSDAAKLQASAACDKCEKCSQP